MATHDEKVYIKPGTVLVRSSIRIRMGLVWCGCVDCVGRRKEEGAAPQPSVAKKLPKANYKRLYSYRLDVLFGGHTRVLVNLGKFYHITETLSQNYNSILENQTPDWLFFISALMSTSSPDHQKMAY